MAKELSEIITERANAFKSSYVPAYKADCEGRPYHAGTIFAVSFPETTVLVTAAHVLERDQKNLCDEDNVIYSNANGAVRQISKFETRLIPIGPGNEKSDYLDLTVFIPVAPSPTVHDVVPEPIPASNLRRTPLHEGHYLVACGFPDTKNSRNGREMSMRPYGYYGTYSSDKETKRVGFDPNIYFTIKIDLKRVYNVYGQKVKAPKAYGISGGPVFLVHDFQSDSYKETELAGVVIERDKSKKYLVCIKAAYIEMAAMTFQK